MQIKPFKGPDELPEVLACLKKKEKARERERERRRRAEKTAQRRAKKSQVSPS